jgi:hypothetical protein
VQAKQAFAFPCTSTIVSTFWRDPSDLNFYPGPPAGRCPFPLASSYRLESMACSPVMHSNSARLVVTLSLPRAGRWRWPAPRPGRGAAPGRLLPAHCRRPARGPAGRHLALCGQAAARILLPNYRHSVAAAGAGRLTEHPGLPSESLTQPQRPSITRPGPARPHTRPSASALASPPTRPPANQPL